jgi:hypothetical protein
MSKIFISCVTGEFGGYRSRLARDLGSSAVHWVTQEQFPLSRFDTVLKLDTEIGECDALIHLIGRGAGATAKDLAVSEFLDNPLTRKLATRLITAIKPFSDITKVKLTYTHWEVLLAKFRGIPIFVFDAAGDITDGHPDDRAPFQPDAGDAECMKAHRERLVHMRLYVDRFFDYDSLKNVVFRTLMSDASQQIRRLRDELKLIASDLELEAQTLEKRRARFGPNTVNELKAVLAQCPDVGTPAFLTLACASLNNGSVGWEFPQNLRVSEHGGAVVNLLIDWAAERESQETFPAVLSLLVRRATALNHTAAAATLEGLLEQACSACGMSRAATEGACFCVGPLDFADGPTAILLTDFERSPPPGVRRAAIQWPGSYHVLDNLKEGGPDSLVEDSRNCLAARPELAVLPLQRIEAFADPQDVNLRWERRDDSRFHRLPVVVRLNRSAVDREELVDAPDRITKANVPCRIGPASAFTQQVEKVGFFFAASTAPEDGNDWLTGAVRSACAGLWLRDPVQPEEALSVLDEIDDVALSALPELVHDRRRSADRSPWHNAALLFDRRDGEFPRRRERQWETHHRLV